MDDEVDVQASSTVAREPDAVAALRRLLAEMGSRGAMLGVNKAVLGNWSRRYDGASVTSQRGGRAVTRLADLEEYE